MSTSVITHPLYKDSYPKESFIVEYHVDRPESVLYGLASTDMGLDFNGFYFKKVIQFRSVLEQYRDPVVTLFVRKFCVPIDVFSVSILLNGVEVAFTIKSIFDPEEVVKAFGDLEEVSPKATTLQELT